MNIPNVFDIEIKPIKSDHVECEEFVRALNCAETSIKDCLLDANVAINIVDDHVISIRPTATTPSGVSTSDIKKIIRGSFCDGDLKLYPEFKRIDVLDLLVPPH